MVPTDSKYAFETYTQGIRLWDLPIHAQSHHYVATAGTDATAPICGGISGRLNQIATPTRTTR